MRLASEPPRRHIALAVVILMASATAHPELPPAKGASPTPAQVAEAIQTVRRDPNLLTVRKERTLKWASEQQSSGSEPPSIGRWIIELFRWIADSTRVLLWISAAILAGMLVVYLVRIARTSGRLQKRERFVAPPSYVRDLDIRPESLPADIGAAARALWDAGEHRSALALLYRGLLSRLVHVHGVPIRDSSTEGDCLALIAGRLSETSAAFASGLVRVWQHAVYGREDIPTSEIHAICSGFGSALGARPDLGESSSGGSEGHLQ